MGMKGDFLEGEVWEEWLNRNRNLIKCHPRTQRAQFKEVVERLEGELEVEGGREGESGVEKREKGATAGGTGKRKGGDLPENPLATGFPPPQFLQRQIYFGKLAPNSKVRPFLILQNNFLNRACWEGLYSTILVAPLSSQLLGGDYRVLIKKRGELKRDSEIVLSAIGPIPVTALLWERGVAAQLEEEEWREVGEKIGALFGFKLL
jgi:mRNA interferase MazF